MQEITNIIILIFILSIIFTLLFLVYRLKVQNGKLKANALQLIVDKGILLEKVSTLAAEKDANSLKEDDGFIKFLSNSRDWAFEYIEDVQSKIDIFQQEVKQSLEILSGTTDENVKALLESCNTLVEILPKEETKEIK